jgi:hypothetical protein
MAGAGNGHERHANTARIVAKLVPILAAHERRARLIAQIQEQAIAAANADRLALQTAKKAGIIRDSRWRKADAVIAAGILKMIAVTILIAALGCILALWM